MRPNIALVVSAVFDSSVLVSAFLRAGGVSGELIELAAQDQFVLVLAGAIIEETIGKLFSVPRLRKRYGYSDDAIREYREILTSLAVLVDEPPPVSGAVRDPNDDVILATAVAAGADYLIARDKDLLVLGSFRDVTITTPEAFRGLLRQQGR